MNDDYLRPYKEGFIDSFKLAFGIMTALGAAVLAFANHLQPYMDSPSDAGLP